MSTSRRDFLKTAGCSLLGAGALAPAVAGVARASGGKAKAEPRTGPRWAMIVDTKKCLEKGACKVCIDACHLAHNVPKIEEPNHEIKWIWKEPYSHAFPTQVHEFTEDGLRDKPVLVACNHCENPPCVKVCPTQATFKRADGVVMMDMHRCIGCRYCMVGCPYGARSFNWKDPKPLVVSKNPTYPTRSKGVVEKCNFCAERISQGQPPACVEASQRVGCGALMFGDLYNPASGLMQTLKSRHNIRRKPFLGTEPHVFYLV